MEEIEKVISQYIREDTLSETEQNIRNHDAAVRSIRSTKVKDLGRDVELSVSSRSNKEEKSLSNDDLQEEDEMETNTYNVEKHIHYLEDTIMELESDNETLKENYNILES